ncbi:hypothetical protein A7X67_00545 [Clostridium sp. W14A]|nr:hypothetical protein A7X67_00545 [Clostridium sp. W14A]
MKDFVIFMLFLWLLVLVFTKVLESYFDQKLQHRTAKRIQFFISSGSRQRRGNPFAESPAARREKKCRISKNL